MSRRNAKTKKIKRSNSAYKLTEEDEIEEHWSDTSENIDCSRSYKWREDKTTINKHSRKTSINKMEHYVMSILPEELSNAIEFTYTLEIFEYMRSRERHMMKKIERQWHHLNTFESQRAMSHRAITIDTAVHILQQLNQDCCLYLTVYLLDLSIYDDDELYLSNVVQMLELKLISAIFTAVKHCSPDPSCYEQIQIASQTLISLEQVEEIEANNLERLDFCCNYDSQLTFFDLYASLLKMPEIDRNICRYILQVGLLSVSLVSQLPSKKAAAAIYLVNYRKYMKSDKSLPKVLQKITGYKPAEIKRIATEYINALHFAISNKLISSLSKYDTIEMLHASRFF